MDRAQIHLEQSSAAKLWQGRAESAFDRLWNVSPPRNMTEGLPHAARLRKRWKIKQRAKRRAVRWLAEQLGIAPAGCDFGCFDSAICKRVIDLCHGMDLTKVRAWTKARGG